MPNNLQSLTFIYKINQSDLYFNLYFVIDILSGILNIVIKYAYSSFVHYKSSIK